MKEFELLDCLNIINIKNFPKYIKEILKHIKIWKKCDECDKRFKAIDIRVVAGAKKFNAKFYCINTEEMDAYSGDWYGENDFELEIYFNGGLRNECLQSFIRKCCRREILK